MQLPETTRLRVAYVAAIVLVGGVFVFGYEHGSSLASRAIAAKRPAAQDAATGTRLASAADQDAKSTQQRPKVQTYKVVKGDTVSGIAQKFGLKTESVLWSNDLGENDTIQEGQELLIPSVDGIIYKVEKGDTVWEIASEHSASVDDIVKANPEVDSGSIQPGQVVLIPGGQPVARQQLAFRGGGSRASHQFGSWPVYGPVTDPFGWRIHPVYGTESFHDGMDIGVPIGTPVQSEASGTVTMAGWYGSYGISVRVDHGGGIVTQYSHLSKALVAVGEKVTAGEEIAYSGNTGVSTGPHVHFMVIVNGSPTDPASWLP